MRTHGFHICSFNEVRYQNDRWVVARDLRFVARVELRFYRLFFSKSQSAEFEQPTI
jgi:hypothetical protein